MMSSTLRLALRAADPIHHARDKVVAHQVVAADHDVVEHRHVREQRQVLEGAADAEAGAVVDRGAPERLAHVDELAAARPIAAGDAVEHRGLAGAVGADDGKNLPALDMKTDVGQRLHAAETDRDVRHLQDALASSGGRRHGNPPSSPRPAHRCRSPADHCRHIRKWPWGQGQVSTWCRAGDTRPRPPPIASAGRCIWPSRP
jgi:hypothetical protein